jgi:hypothetical protein
MGYNEMELTEKKLDQVNAGGQSIAVWLYQLLRGCFPEGPRHHNHDVKRWRGGCCCPPGGMHLHCAIHGDPDIDV